MWTEEPDTYLERVVDFRMALCRDPIHLGDTSVIMAYPGRIVAHDELNDQIVNADEGIN